MTSPVEVFWRLPLDGDGRSLSAESWNRGDYSPHRKAPHPFARTGVQRDGYTYYDHLSQIARAAELTRFDGLWLPTTAAGEDPLIVAGALAREARRVLFVTSARAPLHSAVYTAKIAVSFQRLSGGRLAWHFANEEDPARAWHGKSWTLSEQIERTSEFLDVAKGFWTQAPFTYEGKHYEVLDGGFPPALQGEALPRIFLSGDTDEAFELSARHADVHVLPLAPPEIVRAQIARLDALAAGHNRKLAYGLEGDVVARHSGAEAWADLRRRWEHGRAAPIPISAAAGELLRAQTSTFDEHRVAPHLWSGFGLVRPGPRVGLVGSYDEVAARVAELAALGVSTFVLSANPHLEEAYLVGERVLPRIRAAAAAPLRQSA